MSQRWSLVGISLVVVLIVGTYFGSSHHPPPAAIPTYHGTDPIAVDAAECHRVVALEAARELTFDVLQPDALLQIAGKLSGDCGPVLVEITKPSRSKSEEIVVQSAIFLPQSDACDPMPFDLHFNVPREPGTYTIKVRQPPDHYLARGTLKIIK